MQSMLVMKILHWKLRQDKRVIVLEKTNARSIKKLPEPIELVTIDASFHIIKSTPSCSDGMGEKTC